MTVNQKRKKTNVGISITRHTIEAAVFSEKTKGVEFAVAMPTPEGMLDAEGDQVVNPELLKHTIGALVKQLPGKLKFVNLSIPGTLLRMVPMPRLDPEELYVSLSSEAERYKNFDGTEAVVDFSIMDLPPAGAPPNMANVLFGAVRRDTLNSYVKAISSAKLKLASVELEPLNVMRGMAATGVLDSLVQQIGDTAYWGVIFVEPERVRISLWQGNQLLEFRETNMSTHQFSTATSDAIVVEDMMEEIRRSTKMFQPSIWLTHNMPPAMEQVLGGRLGVPVRTCPIGDGIPIVNPDVSLVTIGATVSSTLGFPVPFDLLAGLSRGGGGGGGGTSSAPELPDVADDSPLPALAIGFGVLVVVLSGLGWVGLTLANSMWAQPTAQKLEADKVQLTADMARLTMEKKQKQENASARQALVGIIENAKIRNRVYTDLIKDIRRKAPNRLWVTQVDVVNDITFRGKALAHEDVLGFAKSFDGLNYIGQVLVSVIHEELVQGTAVLSYKIKGNINLNKALLETPAFPLTGVPPEPADAAKKAEGAKKKP